MKMSKSGKNTFFRHIFVTNFLFVNFFFATFSTVFSAPSGPRGGVEASPAPPGRPAARLSAGGGISRPYHLLEGGKQWLAGAGYPAAGTGHPRGQR